MKVSTDLVFTSSAIKQAGDSQVLPTTGTGKLMDPLIEPVGWRQPTSTQSTCEAKVLF